jgi:DMSO reductase anchor subunit
VKPALSVVLFTVLSGAGLGLFSLLVAADLLRLGEPLGPTARVAGGLAAVALVAGGLVSSMFHLANPKNAWRAFSQFRHSWLSREGVVSVAFFPLALAYVAAVYAGAGTGARALTGVPALALAWAVLLCTGMIYACLKTIPQWHSWLTPANYFLLGHASGALALVLIAHLDRKGIDPLARAAVLLFTVAAAFKAAYYWRARKVSGRHTLAGAIGMTAAQAKLLDVGHSHATFLTREFIYAFGQRHATQLRILAVVAAFAIPLIVLGAAPTSLAGLALACGSCLAGLVIERWLFFAEAEHVAMLYYGAEAA